MTDRPTDSPARPLAPTNAAIPDLTIVTVTYQSRGLVAQALGSALRAAQTAGLAAEIVVVDNASEDGSADEVASAFPTAKVVRNPTNVGFGVASNQAFGIARGRVWLLVNPDATIAPDAIGWLASGLDDAAVAAAAPSLVVERAGAESAGMTPGVVSIGAHFLGFNRLLGRFGGAWRGFQLPAVPAREAVEVDWVSAAVVLVRPAAITAIGGFDESIFLYGEDIDLCDRLRAAGWHVRLEPRARARHQIGGSTVGISVRWVDGLHGIHARRAGRPAQVAFGLVLATGLAVRAVLSRRDRPRHQRMAAAARRALWLAIASARGAQVGRWW
jgi:hypothetical protein